MNAERIETLRAVLEAGVGAEVRVRTDTKGSRAGLVCSFADLGAESGPVVSLAPTGLRRHRVSVRFGRFARSCIEQMQAAPDERKLVAGALLRQAAAGGACEISPNQSLDDWSVTSQDFGIHITLRDIPEPRSEPAIVRTAEAVMVPLMATLAELIGYDDADGDEEYEVEGRLTESVVHRRERSRRNRLLCLSIHGHRCAGCELEPSRLYGEAGAIIEVHHLEPVSNLVEPRPYNPATDLVPLCPNCHRAVHTRRPIPLDLHELRALLRPRDA